MSYLRQVLSLNMCEAVRKGVASDLGDKRSRDDSPSGLVIMEDSDARPHRPRNQQFLLYIPLHS